MGKGLGRAICVGLYVFIVVACGGGGGGGGGGAPPVVLTAISVDPVAATIDIGTSVALTCLGQYSDGSTQTVQADWTNDAPALASLSAAQGTSVLVSAAWDSEGTARITASAQGYSAQAVVTVVDMIPADPGTVYGADETTGTVNAYPSLGGGAPTAIYTGGGPGLTSDRNGAYLYVNERAASGDTDVRRIDPMTGAATTLATLPGAGFDRPISMDIDRQGRVYTNCYGDGQIVRIVPATGAVTVAGHNSGGMLDMAIGPDDAPYYCPIITSPGSTWIYRHDLSSDTSKVWATAPASLTGAFGTGFVIPTGVAINRRGEAFIAEALDTVLYKHKDLNGDGDALDPGETVAYGPIHPGPKDIYMTFGVSAAKGSTVLVNPQPFGGSGDEGIYWLADRDGNGTATGTGEAVKYSSTYTSNGLDGGCITARR